MLLLEQVLLALLTFMWFQMVLLGMQLDVNLTMTLETVLIEPSYPIVLEDTGDTFQWVLLVVLST